LEKNKAKSEEAQLSILSELHLNIEQCALKYAELPFNSFLVASYLEKREEYVEVEWSFNSF